MTQIVLQKEGPHMRVSASGHAVGSPAACAGVSAILFALYGFLLEDGGTTIRSCRLESGEALIDFSGGSSAEAAFHMTAVGLRQIARAYPACVAVEE